MAKLIRPPEKTDVTAFMRMLFLRTERELVNEITRKRSRGLVEYAEAASLERVQRILRDMVDESWSYVPSFTALTSTLPDTATPERSRPLRRLSSSSWATTCWGS